MGEEGVKLSLFADDMILYIENPKDATKKKKTTHKSSLMNSVKLQDTKLTYRNLAFLYINNKLSEREIKKTIIFTITSKRIKYIEINLTKEVNICTQKTLRH